MRFFNCEFYVVVLGFENSQKFRTRIIIIKNSKNIIIIPQEYFGVKRRIVLKDCAQNAPEKS